MIRLPPHKQGSREWVDNNKHDYILNLIIHQDKYIHTFYLGIKFFLFTIGTYYVLALHPGQTDYFIGDMFL